MKKGEKSEEFERFDTLVSQVMAIPKEEIVRRGEEWKKERKAVKKKRAKKPASRDAGV